MVKVLNKGLEVIEFEPQLPYYVRFRINTVVKGIETPYLSNYRLGSITTVIQGIG